MKSKVPISLLLGESTISFRTLGRQYLVIVSQIAAIVSYLLQKTFLNKFKTNTITVCYLYDSSEFIVNNNNNGVLISETIISQRSLNIKIEHTVDVKDYTNNVSAIVQQLNDIKLRNCFIFVQNLNSSTTQFLQTNFFSLNTDCVCFASYSTSQDIVSRSNLLRTVYPETLYGNVIDRYVKKKGKDKDQWLVFIIDASNQVYCDSIVNAIKHANPAVQYLQYVVDDTDTPILDTILEEKITDPTNAVFFLGYTTLIGNLLNGLDKNDTFFIASDTLANVICTTEQRIIINNMNGIIIEHYYGIDGYNYYVQLNERLSTLENLSPFAYNLHLSYIYIAYCINVLNYTPQQMWELKQPLIESLQFDNNGDFEPSTYSSERFPRSQSKFIDKTVFSSKRIANEIYITDYTWVQDSTRSIFNNVDEYSLNK